MAERASIYIGEPLARLLDGHENRSGRLNTVAERYLDIVARDCPALTRAEWCAVCDALNGYWMEGGSNLGVRMAWAEVSDADRLNGLGRKWNVDAEALADRMRDMSSAEQVALAEVVEIFWRHTSLDTDAALAKAGARIAPAGQKPDRNPGEEVEHRRRTGSKAARNG